MAMAIDKLTELYANSAYRCRAEPDVLGEVRSIAATVVLMAGAVLNLAAPFAIVWIVVEAVGFR
ncbi:hypothetical protein GCM10008174_07210 [Methylopila turkensis]|uniref:Uncharacterized protein n=1 Tax=Methylopila turkensis TaxID=1437816 RepID=A0A9W6JNA9_9HYPH|nr:hypothetical protein GCM10008174_07210 [Methylopila turkensis]